MTAEFDNYLTYITVGFHEEKALGTACKALSLTDKRKDSHALTPDNYQKTAISNENIYRVREKCPS